ncbi:DUF481 domain-containing protein [Chryseosolibacter indicus]|nr:DUF481 domain-containing protein [Chryseosolibacter indicus]
MKVLLKLLFLVISHHVFSQFNDTTNYYINYTSTGIINKTNEGNAYVLNNNIKFNIYKKSISLNTANSWIYGEQQDNLTNNDYVSNLDLNLFKTKRHIYYWALTTFERSYSLKINHRLQSGAGVGYYIIDNKNFVLQVSDGLLYEKSDLYDSEAGNNNYQTIRNSFRIKFRWILKDIIVLDNTDFLQHSFKDGDDYIFRSNTNVSVKLRKWLSFTIAVNYNKLNLTKRENLLLNYGLTMEKYF